MKTKSIKNKIKEFFLQNPTTKLRVRQIERSTKTPLPSVIRYTKELEKEQILKTTRIANITVYSADRASKKFILEKKLFNLKSIHTSGLVDCLIEQYSNPTIVLFGSYTKGDDTENSDIDIYIESPKKQDINLKKFEDVLQRKIQIFIYKNIKQIKNKELSQNILNGIVLNGFLEISK